MVCVCKQASRLAHVDTHMHNTAPLVCGSLRPSLCPGDKEIVWLSRLAECLGIYKPYDCIASAGAHIEF